MNKKIYNNDLTVYENQLVKESLIYLKSFIEDMGEFYPFAMVMDKKEIINAVFPNIEDEFPTTQYLINLYNETFEKEYSNKATNYVLSIICIDVFIHDNINHNDVKRNAIEMRFMGINYKKTVQLFYEVDKNNTVIFQEWN
ncbi:MAG: hypothetical protein LBK94_09425 [Prevotellaceae bacterium]|jgi:hypothetical protein|nr:hypothetical protein [Prevotellaceae bacterium]